MSTIPKFTIAEFERMVEKGVFDRPYHRRIELIRGELREMPPAGPTHDELIRFLNEWSFAKTDREDVRVSIQSSIRLAETESVLEPDVAWLRPKSYLNEHPGAADVLLVIEVSDSTLADDRGENANVYVEEEVQDYWIVNVRDWSLEVHRELKDGAYQSVMQYEVHDAVSPLALPHVTLVLNGLFGEFPPQ